MLLFYSYTWSQLQMARRLVILDTRRPETREGQRLPKVTQLVGPWMNLPFWVWRSCPLRLQSRAEQG